MFKKIPLVMGAPTGVGRANSRRLARDEIAIGALDLKLADARKVAGKVAAASGEAIGLHGETANRARVPSAVQALRRASGQVSILVNNAGVTSFVSFLNKTDSKWDWMLEINLKGTFIVAQSGC